MGISDYKGGKYQASEARGGACALTQRERDDPWEMKVLQGGWSAGEGGGHGAQ